MLRLVSVIVQGTLPYLPRLLDAQLIPLQKPLGGFRPIAVGEYGTALAACPNTGSALKPL
jgi:hypothetical protein